MNKVHIWLRTSLVESMAEQIREGENEGRDLSIHVPTDCSNQQEVNSLSSCLQQFVLFCCLLFWCCLATSPKKAEEDLEQLVVFDFTHILCNTTIWRYS